MLFGGLMFGYGMVAANACASRALVLLGRGNLRSLVVVTMVAVTAEMTLKGLIAPLRLAVLHWSETRCSPIRCRPCRRHPGVNGRWRMSSPRRRSAALCWLFAFSLRAVPASSRGQIAAGVAIGLLIPGRLVCHRLSRRRCVRAGAGGSLTFVAPAADTLQYVMFSTGSTLNFGIAVVAGVLCGSFVTALATGRFERWKAIARCRRCCARSAARR